MNDAYIYFIRGWMELSWPDAEIEGIGESPEQHAEKVRRVREALATSLPPERLLDAEAPAKERYRAGWGFPQSFLGGNEYLFFGADVQDPTVVLDLVREVLAIDPFADGYFSVEGEDGEKYRQWLIKSGKIYARKALFPDFDSEEVPQGYIPL